MATTTQDGQNPNKYNNKQRRSTVGFEAGDGGGDKGPTKHLLPSMISQDLSLNSYNEIVTINQEGHHYIDINRLIYQPRFNEKDFGRQKEKLSWYVPDFTFIICNLLSVGISTYFLLIGASTLQWRASISMFSVPNCKELLRTGSSVADINTIDTMSTSRKLENFYYLPCVKLTKDDDFKSVYNYSKVNTFTILKTKASTPELLALLLIAMASLNVVNVFIGISACMKGYKPILVQHIISDVVLVIGSISVTITAAATSSCDEMDLKIVRWLLRHFIRWYGTTTHPPEVQGDKERELSSQVDSLQIGLGCCGVDSWSDYLPAGYPAWDRPLESVQLDGGEAVIPFSCCKRWWIRNIYCSYGAHLWAHPAATESQALQFHERIVQDGCIFKLEQLCTNINSFMGLYGLIAAIVHLVLIVLEAIAASTLIKNINKLIHDQKRAMKKKEIMHEPGESGSELDLSTSTRTGLGLGKESSSHNDPWTKIPPPTEDEIVMIKQRSNFNKFIAAMKYGKVGRWMNVARDTVTEGQQEASETEHQTAEEKKAREKELLHGKNKKETEEHHLHHQHSKRRHLPPHHTPSEKVHQGQEKPKRLSQQGAGDDSVSTGGGKKTSIDEKPASVNSKTVVPPTTTPKKKEKQKKRKPNVISRNTSSHAKVGKMESKTDPTPPPPPKQQSKQKPISRSSSTHSKAGSKKAESTTDTTPSPPSILKKTKRKSHGRSPSAHSEVRNQEDVTTDTTSPPPPILKQTKQKSIIKSPSSHSVGRVRKGESTTGTTDTTPPPTPPKHKKRKPIGRTTSLYTRVRNKGDTARDTTPDPPEPKQTKKKTKKKKRPKTPQAASEINVRPQTTSHTDTENEDAHFRSTKKKRRRKKKGSRDPWWGYFGGLQ